MNEEIVKELKKLNKLLSIILTKELSQREKILFLNKSGFSPKEISEMVGTTANTIRVTLNRLKKSNKI